LFPVGRLDLDSEGLLLLTNDGEVAQAMLHPSLGCEKEYRVTTRGCVSPETRRSLAVGIGLDDGPMAPCQVGPVRYDSRRDASTFNLTLREGRKRLIRRALAARGHPVMRLIRIRMGPLRLGRLRPRQARPLSVRERRALPRASSRGTGQGSG
jgi:pseudouridine synthase